MLVGGSPLRAVRLSPRAEAMVGNREVRVTDAASAILADRLIDANIAVPVLRPGDRAEVTDLTVIVPVRDRIEQLNRTLAGLSNLKVIVVDDASRDATCDRRGRAQTRCRDRSPRPQRRPGGRTQRRPGPREHAVRGLRRLRRPGRGRHLARPDRPLRRSPGRAGRPARARAGRQRPAALVREV